MQKLKSFVYVFKNSAFKPAYYQEILQAPFKFSLKYFLLLFLILSFLTAATLSFFLYQEVNPFLNQLKTQLPDFYPEKLEIQITDGQVTTNVAEPYFVPLNPDFFPEEIKQGLKNIPTQNILVIDTQANPSDIRQYQTFTLLTKSDLAFMAENNEIRIQSLEEIKDFTLNRQLINNLWAKVTPYFPYLIPGMITLSLLFLPLATILAKFIYLALFSSVTLIVVRLFRPKVKSPLQSINYKKSLQINLHAITLPTIIIALFQFLGVQPKIPFFQSIILLIFNLIIFSALRTKSK